MEIIEIIQNMSPSLFFLTAISLAVMYTGKTWATSAAQRSEDSETVNKIALMQTTRADKLGDDLVAQLRETNELLSTVANLQQRVGTLEADLAVEKTKTRGYDDMRGELLVLRQQIVDLTEQLNTSRKSNEAYKIENDKLRRKISDMETQITALENQVAMLKAAKKDELNLLNESEAES